MLYDESGLPALIRRMAFCSVETLKVRWLFGAGQFPIQPNAAMISAVKAFIEIMESTHARASPLRHNYVDRSTRTGSPVGRTADAYVRTGRSGPLQETLLLSAA